MAKTYKHKCIKPSCTQTYEDNDPDQYYCSPCNEERKEIAKQVDAKFANRPKEVKIDTDEIARWKKEGGFMPILR